MIRTIFFIKNASKYAYNNFKNMAYRIEITGVSTIVGRQALISRLSDGVCAKETIVQVVISD